MAKYMLTGSYTTQGVQGLMKDGGTSRVAAAKTLVEAAGGTLDALYFVLGSDDFVLLSTFPDNTSAAAASLVAAASGALNARTSALLTPEEADAAAETARKVASSYRPPGG